MRVVVSLLSVAVLAVTATGCNRRVFEQVNPTCDVTIANDVEIPAEKAADILVVVDNSGSMQEEQDRLAAAFINESGDCPIGKNELKDFARCKDDPTIPVCRFANPSKELLAQPGPAGLADCGFIQVLAAFENDFRIGVITTDVGVCDNRIPSAQAALCQDTNGDSQGDTCAVTGVPCDRNNPCANDWGFRPQRGCLQPNGPPGTPQKVIARQDLLDADPSNDEIGDRFIETLRNIRTFGTPVERGLDAVELFLDPATERPDSCANDLQDFVRDEAKLIVIFLTDEEDCSRAPDVAPCVDVGEGNTCGTCDSETGCEIFGCLPGTSCEPGITEFTGETCGEFAAHFTGGDRLNTNRCYELEGSLTPVSHYVDVLKKQKANASDVSVAVIAGGLPDAEGNINAAGCTFDPANGQQPVGGCSESQGRSNTCAPDENCCFADPGGRYYELAEGLGGLKDTICVDSFGQTMIKIAVFIADVDKVVLAEPPADPALVFVEKAPAGTQDFALIGRLTGTACDNRDGWVLEDDGVTVRFCGDARPGPGEQLRVRAKGDGATSDAPDACVNRGE
jgi:hypothetical protein